MSTDGSSCLEGSGAGLILTNPEGTKFTYALRFEFEASNNEAEYEALIARLRIAEQMGVRNLKAKVERENHSLGEGIKARLGGDNKNWVEELPHVLWTHFTESKSSNGHTPFSLTYGTEAVIPVEIGMPSLWCEKIDPTMNDEALLLNLDILEEIREKAAIQEAKNKEKIKRYYNVNVRSTIFKPGGIHVPQQ
ncbi:reverse transcriptase domain-containing protein [Tanacetum coccineum]